MATKFFSRALFVLLAAAGLTVTSCSQKPKPVTEPPPAPVPVAKAEGIPTTKVQETSPGFGSGEVKTQDTIKTDAASSSTAGLVLADVHFDFDDATIRATELDVLTRNAEALRKKPASRVTLEGHCDERGTESYNMALGMNRAEAVKRHLMSLGVAENQLSTVSFGDTMPLNPGHTEDAWAANRRVHFRIQ